MDIKFWEEELAAAQKNETETKSIIDHWNESAPITGDMHIPLEAILEMHEFDRKEKSDSTMP